MAMNDKPSSAGLGIAGRIAAYFQAAQITPLLALVAFLLGAFAVFVTPREEEPQIDVTMANVLIPFPGAAVADIEQMVTTPAEQVLSQITGVEHVMSVTRPGLAVVTVQYKVGVPRTEALVRLYDTVNANADWLPPGLGVGAPLIKPKGIDDVPIVTLTLYTKAADGGAFDLERVAHSVENDLKRVPGTREVTTIGGPGRAIRVEIDPARMAGAGVTVDDLRRALQSANLGSGVGELLGGNRAVALEAGPFLRDAREVGEIVVGVRAGRPVFLQDVAAVRDGALPAARHVWHGVAGEGGGDYPAVTIAVTKKPGENAIDVADAVVRRVESLRNTVVPAGVEIATTRNYGATADDKARKLIQKLLFATASVVALVFFALGRREAAIVGVAVVLTLTATLFASWAWGFTLNRVSLFALIFSIGILVDDAIVVVENIHRHQALHPEKTLLQLIPGAVDEVGGPTILATLTVIAALLPMAFVSGLMGPYMSPIPINASMGMLLSLAIAFVVTPWLARLWMKSHHGGGAHGGAPGGLTARITPLFQRVFGPLLDERRGARNRGLLGVGVMALIAVSLELPGGRAGRAEDAAVRQQVGVPGRCRHAGRHAGRAHRRRVARDGRSRASPRSRLPGLYAGTAGLADHPQRPGAPVLPSAGGDGGRPAGQPGRIKAHRDLAEFTRSHAPWCPELQQIARRHGANVKVVRRSSPIYGPERPRAGAKSPGRCAPCSRRRPTSSTSTTAASPMRPGRAALSSTAARRRCLGGVPQQAIVSTLRAGVAGARPRPGCTTRASTGGPPR